MLLGLACLAACVSNGRAPWLVLVHVAPASVNLAFDDLAAASRRRSGDALAGGVLVVVGGISLVVPARA
jgi:hypothetical protein